MKDNHVHTNISHDGISSMEQYIVYADKMGIDEITFTEHYDIYDGIKTNLTTLDMESYYNYYKKISSLYKFNINFGIEIGLQPDISDTIKEMVSKYPFDFIIGSSHITCKKDMAMDKSFFDGCTKKEAYTKYFEEVLQNIKIYDEFDVYGHLDYVVRYGGYSDKTIKYSEFKDILDAILIELINKNKGIEINTSGIRYGLGTTHPNIDILKRYKQLGGSIITIGSDAHKVDDLARDFDIAYDMLESVGFDTLVQYHNRKPQSIKIKNLR